MHPISFMTTLPSWRLERGDSARRSPATTRMASCACGPKHRPRRSAGPTACRRALPVSAVPCAPCPQGSLRSHHLTSTASFASWNGSRVASDRSCAEQRIATHRSRRSGVCWPRTCGSLTDSLFRGRAAQLSGRTQPHSTSGEVGWSRRGQAGWPRLRFEARDVLSRGAGQRRTPAQRAVRRAASFTAGGAP